MKNKFLALLISSAFLFAACDDSSSASTDSSGEEISSSSKDDSESSSSNESEVSSSSETPVSSSSAESSSSEESSSSIVLPEETRAATLVDLPKNVELKLFDQTVYLSTGSKQGVLALRIPDELWAVTYTDFANGVVSFDTLNTGMEYVKTDAVSSIKTVQSFTLWMARNIAKR